MLDVILEKLKYIEKRENISILLAVESVCVLRPILACRWILDKGTPPPMLFAELMDAELEECMKPSVEQLLGIKMNTPEVKEIPRVDILNHYIDVSIPEIRETIEAMPEEENNGWEELNALFLSELERE